MKSALKLIISATALCGYAQLASAEGEDYVVNAARVQGNLQCALSKNDGGTFDCTLHVKGQGQVAITMSAQQDKNGNNTGYTGTDRVQEGTLNYTLAVCADNDKNMQGVAMVTDNMDGSSNSFVANVAASQSSKLAAAQISPIAITFVDQNSLTVDLSFVVYGTPDDNIVTSKDTKGLQEMLINKIRPYLKSLAKR